MKTMQSGFAELCKPYVAMISLQFGYAGTTVITKLSLDHGMSHYVLAVYRHAFAALSIAPFALILEKKVRPRMTLPILIQVFALGLLGPVIDQNLHYACLKFTSPTFSSATGSMLPAMTFLLAVICRMEKMDLSKLRCQAKVVGSLVTVAGAMLMTLYRGPLMEMLSPKHMRYQANMPAAASGDNDWLKGCIFLIIAALAWASFFVLQAAALKRYDAPLSLTSLICVVGTLQATVVTFIMEHSPSAWKIGWDMNLLAAAYAGLVTSSIAYYVQGLVIQEKGPVFASAFSPLTVIIVAILGSFILAEKINLGGVGGSALIVLGLFCVLWGKHKDNKEVELEVMDIPLTIKETHGTEAMEIVELEKAIADNKLVSAIVTVSVPQKEDATKMSQEER